eukprot:TRINITY_DN14657_c0_g1_i1.p1 TRINITY_DN14657_c0_g1~~TRINITY_DN14657_c0_g1_i1.p1  ORF type:complete len:401 (+),score=87.60 TRINITY_DN14657_c0_g1_i1:63-1205(+)
MHQYREIQADCAGTAVDAQSVASDGTRGSQAAGDAIFVKWAALGLLLGPFSMPLCWNRWGPLQFSGRSAVLQREAKSPAGVAYTGCTVGMLGFSLVLYEVTTVTAGTGCAGSDVITVQCSVSVVLWVLSIAMAFSSAVLFQLLHRCNVTTAELGPPGHLAGVRMRDRFGDDPCGAFFDIRRLRRSAAGTEADPVASSLSTGELLGNLNRGATDSGNCACLLAGVWVVSAVVGAFRAGGTAAICLAAVTPMALALCDEVGHAYFRFQGRRAVRVANSGPEVVSSRLAWVLHRTVVSGEYSLWLVPRNPLLAAVEMHSAWWMQRFDALSVSAQVTLATVLQVSVRRGPAWLPPDLLLDILGYVAVPSTAVVPPKRRFRPLLL